MNEARVKEEKREFAAWSVEWKEINVSKSMTKITGKWNFSVWLFTNYYLGINIKVGNTKTWQANTVLNEIH